MASANANQPNASAELAEMEKLSWKSPEDAGLAGDYVTSLFGL